MTPAGRQDDGSGHLGAPSWMDGLLRDLLKGSTHSTVRAEPLPGGVSSDIFRVTAGETTFCVKRALPKLKVAAEWRAPVERNRYEVAWMRTAAAIVPKAVPPVLAEDPAAGAFAMAWLPPERYPVWKAQLRDGILDPRMAGTVGDALGRIHAATADDDQVARRFPTDAVFHAIRLEPYLVATARAHPDLAERLHALVERTAATKRVLVHGDYSPKNLLAGPDGPVILDAECAWFGDPAFDLAFVLNHLLLKGAWKRHWRRGYLYLFEVLVDAYRMHVRWEPWVALDARTAALLPGLMLGRIDGKSPVEYLTGEADREAVRTFARERVAAPPATLAALAAAWERTP
jgi:aminoglycoside phosphotransferase (APT) family kinase protein